MMSRDQTRVSDRLCIFPYFMKLSQPQLIAVRSKWSLCVQFVNWYHGYILKTRELINSVDCYLPATCRIKKTRHNMQCTWHFFAENVMKNFSLEILIFISGWMGCFPMTWYIYWVWNNDFISFQPAAGLHPRWIHSCACIIITYRKSNRYHFYS